MISRVNAFLGFAAVSRIKIVQKQVEPPAKIRPRLRPLSGSETEKLDTLVDGIEDEGLRNALAKLGRSVIGTKR